MNMTKNNSDKRHGYIDEIFHTLTEGLHSIRNKNDFYKQNTIEDDKTEDDTATLLPPLPYSTEESFVVESEKLINNIDNLHQNVMDLRKSVALLKKERDGAIAERDTRDEIIGNLNVQIAYMQRNFSETCSRYDKTIKTLTEERDKLKAKLSNAEQKISDLQKNFSKESDTVSTTEKI
ncbi:MAG: hypothetical protein K6G55_06550 [Selenomonadaceae bacterium]|nr:hypothetical protein [Selenomonadaceae bacterium]